MKPIPLLSSTLLLITYGIFGWSLANAQASVFLYLVVIAGIFLLDAILTFRFLNLKTIIPWFNSELYTFISAIVTAFFFVVIIRWINIFTHSLVLISAGILVRLDTQIYGLKNWHSFGILLIISEGGLGLGVGLYLLLKNHT
ncbi:MAG: hypothetical protein F6K40_04130 [Okeania sp. SIO3I5]|uniref:hypothetical protein n=1 Tax=Okeania sp. SIO3I5 TaxID=2607805 RepID=UPI0013B6DA6B|nr:hypothetical protein [Okeania sp. SIO3I5]NEQ35531.1 hypothetical protein [Okeania sp. SIO3I5]